ncbi:unannotated protein [freshwater metagenome]|uniref:Unannotated protein n=1 Tax=freshwater metagenome TaxID=449393 RepID=A0A6J7NPR0_9ZZZZ
MSRTQSAPMIFASQMSFSLTVKSLRNRGNCTAARAICKSATEPPKWASSVSTDKQLAPPTSYDCASSAGSISLLSTPLDGDFRLISAITAKRSTESFRMRSANSRPKPQCAALSISASRLRVSTSIRARCSWRILSRYKRYAPLPPIGVRKWNSGAPSTNGAREAEKALNASVLICALQASWFT